MGFESQEQAERWAERWAESVEFRAEQMKEEKMLASEYTGPERRYSGMPRELYDWTWRSEHHDNKYALTEARDLDILWKLYQRALKRDRRAEANALFSGIYELQQKLHARRKRIADECAPWFQ